MAELERHVLRYTSKPTSGGYPDGWTWTLMAPEGFGAPMDVQNHGDGTWRLRSIEGLFTRVKNDMKPMVTAANTYPRGHIKTPNPLTCHWVVEGVSSESVSVTHGPTEFVSRGSTYTSSNAYTPKDQRNYYIWNFPDDRAPILKTTSKSTLVYDDGYIGGGVSGISMGLNGYLDLVWVVTKVADETEPPEPPKPPEPPQPSANHTTWITDLMGAPENPAQGVLKDYVHVFNQSASNCHGTSPSGDDLIDVSATSSQITVTAKRRDSDYPNVGHGSVYYDCGYWTGSGEDRHYVDTSFSVTVEAFFYEKTKRHPSLAVYEERSSLNWLSRDIASCIKQINQWVYFTQAAKAHNAFQKKTKDLGEFVITNNNSIHMSQYFGLDSDSSNVHKIADDHRSVEYLFTFYNSDVMTKTSPVTDMYKRNTYVNLTIHCSPTDISQFSYIYLDRNNNQVAWSDVPGVVLMNQEDIMVGNLYYANETIEGGYCRAFRITFRDKENGTVYTRYDLISSDSYDGVWNGKIMELGDSHYNQLPEKRLMKITIEPYFYFNDSPHTAYSDCSLTITEDFLKIKDEDLCPKLVFPLLSSTAPWTEMRLYESERFGWNWELVVSDNWDRMKSVFGLRVNGVDCYPHIEERYWSSNHVTKHMIWAAGIYWADYNMFIPALKVQPFVITMYNTPQEKRIYAPPNDVMINTSKPTHWVIPLAEQGEYLHYDEADKLDYFINKYKPLPGTHWPVIKEKRGSIISIRFWLNIRDKINTDYVDRMERWMYYADEVSSTKRNIVTNPMACWRHTSFKYKQGEYLRIIINYATHDYLNQMRFTHNYLHQFTHNQIQRMARYNNLKQNYFDIMSDVNKYREENKG